MVVTLGLLGALAAAWQWTPLKETIDPDQLSDWLRPHRTAWYGLPVTIAAFVLLGFAMVPVLVMVVVTGMVFGPWLGSAYALAGCLASAALAFGVGRKLGQKTVARLAGERARRIGQILNRNGILAVFLMRKVPAPYVLANIMAGASRIRFLDFMIGTLLGMGSIVIILSVFGYQLLELREKPTAGSIAFTVVLPLVSFGIALTVNRIVQRRRSKR
jgi:phospholipase D1/2